MAKTMLIMRHAKSSWADSSMTDHQRPLNKRGRRNAPVMAALLFDKQLTPNAIIHSSAMRTTITCELMVETFTERGAEIGSVQSRDDLYHAPAETYLEIISRVQDTLETVLLLGHNPGIEHLVDHLSGDYETMPTAAIACFTTEVSSWSKIQREDWTLFDVWRPKEI